jgi:two-component system, chemotaxis family, protein-glutamate methylesterase/glutaminase
MAYVAVSSPKNPNRPHPLPPKVTVSSPSPYAAFDLVTIVASLGGIEAVPEVLSALPADFPAAVAICQHTGPRSPLALPRILGRRSRHPIAYAVHGEPIVPGRIYTAPPDQHLMVSRDRRVVLSHGLKVKSCRPAGDPLLVSAAAAYGERVLGVVLTGCNTDGAAGAQAIKWTGGMMLAQDLASSRAKGMPRAAIATGCVDLALPLEAIGPALVALVMAPGAAAYLRVPMQAA